MVKVIVDEYNQVFVDDELVYIFGSWYDYLYSLKADFYYLCNIKIYTDGQFACINDINMVRDMDVIVYDNNIEINGMTYTLVDYLRDGNSIPVYILSDELDSLVYVVIERVNLQDTGREYEYEYPINTYVFETEEEAKEEAMDRDWQVEERLLES